MNVKPILFNPQMVRAILDGRKTQTRRTAFPNMELREFCNKEYPNGWWFNGRVFRSFDDFLHYTQRPKCKYQPGDILWVRETWSTHYDGIHDDLQFCYKADGVDLKAECMPGENNRWWPSIHMPKDAARIFLCVKSIRVEHLHDIKEKDAVAEGMPDSLDYPVSPAYCPRCHGEGLIGYHNGHGFVEEECSVCNTPTKRFGNFWNSCLKKADLDKYGWAENPWVWVVEFERCEKPEGWCE